MKKTMFVLFIVLVSTVNGQQTSRTVPFSAFDFGIYAGVGVFGKSSLDKTLLLQGKTNLNDNVNIHFSVGYNKVDLNTSTGWKDHSLDYTSTPATIRTIENIIKKV